MGCSSRLAIGIAAYQVTRLGIQTTSFMEGRHKRMHDQAAGAAEGGPGITACEARKRQVTVVRYSSTGEVF
jgi:hypothetical protein